MDWYLPDPADRLDPRASPLLAADLAGLPPAYVAVAGFDPLRDEGESYAHRMRAAGVPVAPHRHASLIHAFVNTTGVGRTGREAMLQACGALRAGVAGSTRRPSVAG
jgi:acetyl esterase